MPKKSNDDAWREASRQIVEAHNWREIYSADFGIEIKNPDAKGWGEVQGNPSAYVHVPSGRYYDHGREVLNLGPFDFAFHKGKFPDWREARKEYAKRAGIALPKGKEPARPEDKLTFRPWNDALVFSWCDGKLGISPEAVKLAGGRIARWPTTGKYTVIAFPIFGPQLLAADPIGFTLYNITGQPLPDGSGNPRKMLLAGGSQKGWLGLQGLERIACAEVVWKLEGTTDLLAVMTAMQRAGISDHAAISNSHGSTENPQDDMCVALAGKKVFVLHDTDGAGEVGAKRWAECIAKYAKEVRRVRLPYSQTESKGRDVRDFLNGVVEEVAAA